MFLCIHIILRFRAITVKRNIPALDKSVPLSSQTICSSALTLSSPVKCTKWKFTCFLSPWYWSFFTIHPCIRLISMIVACFWPFYAFYWFLLGAEPVRLLLPAHKPVWQVIDLKQWCISLHAIRASPDNSKTKHDTPLHLRWDERPHFQHVLTAYRHPVLHV